ncbi:MAG: DNA repair protein RecO [Pseudomonadota bacterium]
MRSYLKTPALILSGRDLNESDRLMSLLSRDLGRFSAVAKGAKRSTRRFAGCLELFSLVEACLIDSGRGLLLLESCALLDPYPAIRADVARYGHACFLCEMAKELFPEREPFAEAFNLLSHALAELNAGGHILSMSRMTELRLLVVAGFAPQLGGCRRCQAPVGPQNMRFVPEQGSVFCPTCAPEGHAVDVSAGTLRLLMEAARLDLAKLSRLHFSRWALDESGRLLADFVRCTLRKDLKSRKFLESL